MSNHALVELDRSLKLRLCSVNAGQSVEVRLSRIGAQHLADALLAFAGAHGRSDSKSARGSRCAFGADDLMSAPEPIRRAGVVRLTDPPAGSRRGVVKAW